MDSLARIADRYCGAKVLCNEHAAQVRRVAARCGNMTVETINAYLKRRLQEVSATTAKNERGLLLALWRYAYETRLRDDLPRGVVKIKPPRKPTVAWTVDDLKRLLAAADATRGILRSGLRRSEFLRAWILIGYASGARFGDIWRFGRQHLDGDVLRWTQSKTGEPISKILDKATLRAIEAVLRHSPDGRIVGWACSRGQAMRIMRSFLDDCGLAGSSKWLRRSGATHIEIAQPGFGRHHCGHRTASMVEKHYLDWGQIRRNSPVPPALVD